MSPPASEFQMSEAEGIRHATIECISSFKACLSIKPLMKDSWAESRLADLNLWASGVGALARPEASLDRRLQFQPKPRLVLTNLLLTLQEFVNSCRIHVLNETHGEIEDFDEEAESDDISMSPAESAHEPRGGGNSNRAKSSASWFTALASDLRAGSDTSTDSDEGDGSDEEQSEVTLKEVMKDVDDLMDQLIILGFAIRKSGTAARLHKADASFNPYENKDLRKHLEMILLNDAARRRNNGEDNKEVTANKRMQELTLKKEITPEQRHFIMANLRRRHRFRYARRHHQKLDQFTVKTLVSWPKPQSFASQEITVREDRSQISRDQRLPQTEDSPKEILSAAPPETPHVQEMSATAPSAVEGDILQITMPTPSAASRVSVSVTKMHYPSPPPKSQFLKGFKCPCCYQTLPEMFKDWSRWRKHLMEDLCPYTCPFIECPSPEVLYTSRAAWRDHVLQNHGTGENWECLICAGTGTQNTFLSAADFVSHNKTRHKDAISEDQIINLQDTCHRIALPNISRCPLCPWPQDEEAMPDAAANLEHIGNCIHKFSLNALPWAESLTVDTTELLKPDRRRNIEEWLESTEEGENADFQKIDIKTFHILPTPPSTGKQEVAYIPEEYFAENSQVEGETLSLDSDLPEARGTYSDDNSQPPNNQEAAHVPKDDFAESSQMEGGTMSLNPDIPEARRTYSNGSDPNNYTIGWISALEIEYVAAQEFLDEEHEGPKWVHQNDENHYTLGRIGKHNVVIAVLPRRDNGAAVAAMGANDMMHTFPNIRVCLMVGIGGGVPSKRHDIRLGDVVVSSPTFSENQGGVIQYDYVRTIQGRRFQGTRYLNRPSRALLSSVSRLNASRIIKEIEIGAAIKKKLEANQRLQKNYGRPDPGSDKLYSSDPTQTIGTLIVRPERSGEEDNPAIHYGLIASSDGFMEDSQTRDILAEELDVLCFEREAAGLVNDFPCLIIRGISDYSDQHWYKEWRGYASMSAAAYATALLKALPTHEVDKTQTIKDLLLPTYMERARNVLSSLSSNQKKEVVSAPTDLREGQAVNSSIDQSHQMTPFRTAESQQANTDISRDKNSIKHVYVAVMGATGAGKSSFISMCTGKNVKVGHGLESSTTDIEDVEFMLNDKICVHLIDTPGFDDINRSDVEVLQTIAYWLSTSFQSGTKLSGIIYLHRITDVRMAGSARRNLVMFRKLCGENVYSSVVLATTMWSLIDEPTGAQRERELVETEEYWGYMHKKGSPIFRVAQTRESCLSILQHIITLDSTVVLQLQHEIVNEGHLFEDTKASMHLNEDIIRERKKNEAELQELKMKMQEMARQNDELQRFLKEERDKVK